MGGSEGGKERKGNMGMGSEGRREGEQMNGKEGDGWGGGRTGELAEK